MYTPHSCVEILTPKSKIASASVSIDALIPHEWGICPVPTDGSEGPKLWTRGAKCPTFSAQGG